MTDHLHNVAQLRALAGRQQPIHEQLAGIVGLVQRLETATRSWRAFAPRPAGLDAVITQADALPRALRELRAGMLAEVPDDAA